MQKQVKTGKYTEINKQSHVNFWLIKLKNIWNCLIFIKLYYLPTQTLIASGTSASNIDFQSFDALSILPLCADHCKQDVIVVLHISTLRNWIPNWKWWESRRLTTHDKVANEKLNLVPKLCLWPNTSVCVNQQKSLNRGRPTKLLHTYVLVDTIHSPDSFP